MADPKTKEELLNLFDGAFGWLANAWDEDETGELTWTDLRAGFTKELAIDDADKHPVVTGFLKKVDDLRVSDEEDEQYDLLTDDSARESALAPLIEEWARTHRWDDERGTWLVWHDDESDWRTKDGKSIAELDAEDGDTTREPEVVAGDIVSKIIVTALDEALEQVPELAEMSKEDRDELIARTWRESLAAEA
jgi:hypothetical protein